MGESFDHRPARWIRQSRKCCIQVIHNHMVVNYPSMSSVDFGARITGHPEVEPGIIRRVRSPLPGSRVSGFWADGEQLGN